MLSTHMLATRAHQRLQTFARRSERWLMPAMLVAGTALDAVQFRVLNTDTTLLIAGVYAVICAAAIIFMAVPVPEGRRVVRTLQRAAPYAQQFTIGALLGTAMLFYWYSGSVLASWPIIGIVVILMVANETLRRWFVLPAVQIPVLYLALFALLTTLSAYVFNTLSSLAFIAGGVASLLIVAGFLVVFLRCSARYTQRRQLWFSVTAVFASMNILYFLNIIPPIPLSLREAGMYTAVTREGGDYVLEGGEATWLARLLPGQTLRLESGQRVYAYAAVFAPIDFRAAIYHRWEFHDGEQWVTRDRLSYSITGGRSEGYRGYTMKTSVTPGRWRVSVETERGQVLGRMYFRVVEQ